VEVESWELHGFLQNSYDDYAVKEDVLKKRKGSFAGVLFLFTTTPQIPSFQGGERKKVESLTFQLRLYILQGNLWNLYE